MIGQDRLGAPPVEDENAAGSFAVDDAVGGRAVCATTSSGAASPEA